MLRSKVHYSMLMFMLATVQLLQLYFMCLMLSKLAIISYSILLNIGKGFSFEKSKSTFFFLNHGQFLRPWCSVSKSLYFNFLFFKNAFLKAHLEVTISHFNSTYDNSRPREMKSVLACACKSPAVLEICIRAWII